MSSRDTGVRVRREDTSPPTKPCANSTNFFLNIIITTYLLVRLRIIINFLFPEVAAKFSSLNYSLCSESAGKNANY